MAKLQRHFDQLDSGLFVPYYSTKPARPQRRWWESLRAPARDRAGNVMFRNGKVLFRNGKIVFGPCTNGCCEEEPRPCEVCQSGTFVEQFQVTISGVGDNGCSDCEKANGVFVCDYESAEGGEGWCLYKWLHILEDPPICWAEGDYRTFDYLLITIRVPGYGIGEPASLEVSLSETTSGAGVSLVGGRWMLDGAPDCSAIDLTVTPGNIGEYVCNYGSSTVAVEAL